MTINEKEVTLVENDFIPIYDDSDVADQVLLDTINENSLVKIDTTDTDVADQRIPFFKKGDAALLKEIKQFNNLENLVLTGEYSKHIEKNFGFFRNIQHYEGKEIYYPVIGSLINKIFINTNALSNGAIYTFEVKIARLTEREYQGNPFLLEASIKNIQEIIKLSEIQQEILKKEIELKKFENEIQNIELDFEKRKNDGIIQVNNFLQEKEIEANKINEQYNLTIAHKFNELEQKENLIAEMDNEIFNIQTQLSEYSNKKSEMESTLNFLRQKIETCKNLEFSLSEYFPPSFQSQEMEIRISYGPPPSTSPQARSPAHGCAPQRCASTADVASASRRPQPAALRCTQG